MDGSSFKTGRILSACGRRAVVGVTVASNVLINFVIIVLLSINDKHLDRRYVRVLIVNISPAPFIKVITHH